MHHLVFSFLSFFDDDEVFSVEVFYNLAWVYFSYFFGSYYEYDISDFLGSLLFIYAKGNSLCLLILCSKTLLKMFLRSESFLDDSLGSFMYRLDGASVTHFFLILFLCVFFFFNPIAKAESTVLNQSKSGHLHLVPVFRGNNISNF